MWWNTLLPIIWHISCVSAFSWTKTPGIVHACLHGDAEFPWDFNTSMYDQVSSLEWFFLGTDNTVLAAEKKGGVWVVRDPYYPEIYGDRSYRMDTREAFAGLLLKNVTREDEGTYRVIVGGYSNVRSESDLSIHTYDSLKPDLLLDNEPVDFDSTLNKTGQGRVTVTVSTAAGLPANISISHGDSTIICYEKRVCSEVIQTGNFGEVSVRFILDYSVCRPQDRTINIVTGLPAGAPDTPDATTTTPSGQDDVPPTKFHLWYIAIIVLLVIIILILSLALIWITYRRRERRGKTLKPHQSKYANFAPINVPMSFIAKSTVWKNGQSRNIEKQNGGSSSGKKEEIPLVERPSPVNRLGPGNGNTLFINIARAKGLTDEVINSLLEEDFDTEEALGTMEDDYLQSMDIPEEEKESLKRWLHELLSRSHGSSESRETNTLTRHLKTPSTPLSESTSGDFSIEDCLRNLQMSEKNEREIREYVLENGVLGLEALLRNKLDLYMGCPVNIAVTGRSGTGKSSLINTLRGLRARDKGAAKVGVVETTFEMKPYNHPDISNVLFWDLPGVNTPNFPRATYLTDVEFRRYDAFMIACTERLTQDDMWLAKEAATLGTPFYFLRTKIDVDVVNNKRDGDGNEKKLLANIRSQIEENLAREELPGDRVFLISNVLKNKRKWDFPKLARDLVARTPERNKFAMVMAMVTCSKEIIMLKKDDLYSRITTVALTAALSEGEHEDIIKREIALYAECFGVNDANMQDVDMEKLNARLKDIKSMLNSIMNQEVEESTKGRQVGKYFLGIGYFVGMIIDDAITKSRKAEAAKTQDEFTQITGQVAKEVIVEEAIFILQIVLGRCEELALAVLEQRQYMDT